MTSTPFNVGLGDGSRSSSRVLRPPGGGHTDIFGGEPEPPRGRRAVPAAAAAIVHGHGGQGDEPARKTNGTAPSQNGQASEPQEAPAAPAPTTPPAPAPAAPPAPVPAEPPVSPVTPSAPAEPKSVSPKAVTPTEPSKRVRVPPGGFSSGLW